MHITNQSSLIKIYQMVHINIDDNFGVTRCSTQHAPANMSNTLKALREKITKLKCYSHEPGSEVRGKVTNLLVKGLTEYTAKVDMESSGDDKEEPLDVDDLNAL